MRVPTKPCTQARDMSEIQRGAGRKLLEGSKASAHRSRLRKGKEHVSIPAGRWKKVPGRFRRQAHSGCSVVVYAAAIQSCCPFNLNPATLPKKEMCNVPAGRWKKVPGRFKSERHIDSVCSVVKDVTVGQIGCAIDGKASTLPNKRRLTFQRGAGRKFQEGSEGEHAHRLQCCCRCCSHPS